MIENTNKEISLLKYKDVRADWAFFIYFTVMYLLYTNTIIQLVIQIFILAYVIYMKIWPKNLVISLKKDTIKNIALLVVWMGGLTALFFLSSKLWAYGHLSDSHTIMGVFRCFGIGFGIFLYCDSTEKVLSLLQSFAYASFIMGIVAIITTSPDQYFQAGDDGFGQLIGQQRNGIGAVGAGMTVMCLYLKRYTNFKYGNILSVFFLFLTVLTGSRGSIIQLLILFVLIVIIDKNFLKMSLKAIFFLLAIILVLLLIRYIPILYENIWERFIGMFLAFQGDDAGDASTMGRQFYREIAWEMFKQKPLLGYGLDGFVLYLLDNPIYKGYYIEAVYSHCNYSELMANLGMAGLLVWYVPVFYVLAMGYKNREHHPLIKITFFWLMSMVILDYARIPWHSHPSMYQYYLAFLIILLMSNKFKPNKNKTT